MIYNTSIRFVALMLSVLTVGTLRAQDPAFSQYAANPVYNNPGMVGLFDGEVRLTANYRDQWSSVLGDSPLRTYAGAAELRYSVGGKDFIGVAVNALRDEGGQASLTLDNAGLSLAMQKYLGGGRGRDATYLGFGGRVGYGQMRLDPTALWYSSNLDTNSFAIDPSGISAGSVGVGNAYLDVSAGLSLAIVRRDYSVQLGLAGHHLNWPNSSLLYNSELLLPPRISGLIAGELLMRNDLRMLPSITFDLQKNSRRIQVGSGILYRGRQGDAGFRFGTYARLANDLVKPASLEAIVLVAQVELARTTFGLSYDVNTGQVGRAVNARGAYELSLAWTREGRSRYKVICPKL